MAQVTVELLKRAAEYAAFRAACIKDMWELFQGSEECLEGLETEQAQALTDAETLERLAALVGKAERHFGKDTGKDTFTVTLPVTSSMQWLREFAPQASDRIIVAAALGYCADAHKRSGQ